MTQVVKRSPVNLRPALRIKPAHNDKSLGPLAPGYARLAGAARRAPFGSCHCPLG